MSDRVIQLHMPLAHEDLAYRVKELYDRIDAVYVSAARDAGFSCAGCDGAKCCAVDLILHTFAEQLYLRRGLDTLDAARRDGILTNCTLTLHAKESDPFGESYRDAVCVLNEAGLCALYKYRPMICRLAGIPHLIFRPDGTKRFGEGCGKFRSEIEPRLPDLRIDRTAFYREMGSIELGVVRVTGRRSTSRTVAETLAFADPDQLIP
ncbi:MAG: hypothetical protein FJ118_06440 [Deltaproteobacteria bacterium]|nr:hypothetical protein [Deltaproteobacteria bacterium]